MTDKLPPKILVVESDEVLRASLCNTIERYWFNVIRADNAENALKRIEFETLNLIIISSRVVGTSALELATRVRRIPSFSELPIIFIIDEGEQPSNYKLADTNLVEFIYRPFTPNEIMTAIKSLLRRSKPTFQDKVIKYKDISIDLLTYRVFIEDRKIHLGPTEFKILQLLLQSPKTIYSRQQIIDFVWGSEQVIETRTVDVHVNRLRKLIKRSINDLPIIKTVRSSGYCLSLPGEID